MYVCVYVYVYVCVYVCVCIYIEIYIYIGQICISPDYALVHQEPAEYFALLLHYYERDDILLLTQGGEINITIDARRRD